MGIEAARLPIGQKVTLPGHFDQAVTLEGVRPLGKGFECRVRLADGSLDETVISEEEAQFLIGETGVTETTTIIPADADQVRLLVESTRIRLAYLSLDFATKPPAEKEALAREFMEKCGNKPRLYKNGLALAIPAADQTESLRRDVRYFIAVDRVSKAAKKHNLTKEQADELRERKSTHESAAESAFVKLYPEVWLPKLDQGKITIEKIAAGGRPLQATVSGSRKAMVFERSMELLTAVQSRVFSTLKPGKIVELFRLGEDQPPRMGIRCSEVVSGFYSFLGFTRLASKEVVQKAVAEGIKNGDFGYFSGSAPTLDSGGKYQVARSKVRFNGFVSDDEIDLESGFLMLPQSIPVEAAPQSATGATTGPVSPAPTQPHDEATPHPEPAADPGPQPVTEKVFQVSFTADRDKLYTAWNAVANLADIAGKVEINLRAESETGFDKSKLQNGVLEPLREADLIE
jgi:hypothetical protein